MLFNIIIEDWEIEDSLNILIDVEGTSTENLKNTIRKIVDDACEIEKCLSDYIFCNLESLSDNYPQKLKDLLKAEDFQRTYCGSTEFAKIVSKRPYLQNLTLKCFEGTKTNSELIYDVFRLIMKNENIKFNKPQIITINKWRTSK